MIADSSGWFGRPSEVPGGVGRHTKVHYIKPNGKCACGYKPHPSMQFQWCAAGILWYYLECPKCKQWAEQHTRRVPEVTTADIIKLRDEAISRARKAKRVRERL